MIYIIIIKKINIPFLPDGEKAVNAACLDSFIISLSSSWRVFHSYPTEELSIVESYELSCISDHCLSVSKDGRVFVLGSNNMGSLCLCKKDDNVREFTEIFSLKKYFITTAYAGLHHSFFQTTDGKILSCGCNSSCQLVFSKPSRKCIYIPVEMLITSGATFCIAGSNSSIIFSGFIPPNMSNRTIKNHLVIT